MPRGARQTLIFGLLAAAAPIAAAAERASPIAVACHDEATRQYIADFRRIGAREQTSDDTVAITFVNNKLKYQDYYDECLARWNSRKLR